MANVTGSNPIFIDTANRTTPQVARYIYINEIYIVNRDPGAGHTCIIYDQGGVNQIASVSLTGDTGVTPCVSIPCGGARVNGIWVKNHTQVGAADINLSIFQA